jgi:hypothetical protein
MTLLVLIHILLVIVETPSPQMTSMSLGGLHVPVRHALVIDLLLTIVQVGPTLVRSRGEGE